MVRFVSWFVLRDEECEDRGQQHEDERLHNSDEQLHKVKRNRYQPGKRRHKVRHCFQHVFPRVNVPVQAES